MESAWLTPKRRWAHFKWMKLARSSRPQRPCCCAFPVLPVTKPHYQWNGLWQPAGLPAGHPHHSSFHQDLQLEQREHVFPHHHRKPGPREQTAVWNFSGEICREACWRRVLCVNSRATSPVSGTCLTFDLCLARATKWMTCWPLTSARCWQPWPNSGVPEATASKQRETRSKDDWGLFLAAISCNGWVAHGNTAHPLRLKAHILPFACYRPQFRFVQHHFFRRWAFWLLLLTYGLTRRWLLNYQSGCFLPLTPVRARYCAWVTWFDSTYKTTLKAVVMMCINGVWIGRCPGIVGNVVYSGNSTPAT